MILDVLRKWMGLRGDRRENGKATGGGSSDDMSCEEALSRIYEYLDGELDPAPRQLVKAHFEVCQRCYPYLASERSFKLALARAMEGQRAPEGVRARLLAILPEGTA